jgi:hypothetical protein
MSLYMAYVLSHQPDGTRQPMHSLLGWVCVLVLAVVIFGLTWLAVS